MTLAAVLHVHERALAEQMVRPFDLVMDRLWVVFMIHICFRAMIDYGEVVQYFFVADCRCVGRHRHLCGMDREEFKGTGCSVCRRIVVSFVWN